MWAKLFLAAGLVVLAGVCSPVLAMHDATAGDLENLRRRIEALEGQQAPPAAGEAMIEVLGKKLSLTGLVEVEAAYNQVEGGAESSDLNLATAQLGIEAHVSEEVGAHLVLLYEEGDSDALNVDEAVITLHLLDERFMLAAGKQYLPFGHFSSHLVSDPLTLDLGETNDTALILRWHFPEIAEISLAAFNGQADQLGNDDQIDSWVAALEVAPVEGVTIGASYLSDVAESDLGLVQDDPLLGNIYNDSIPAAAAFVSLAFGPVTLEGEYVGALANFDPAVVALGSDLTGQRPQAWNLELAVVPTEKWQIAARAEEARDFRNDVVRYGTALSWGFLPNTVLALEYLHDDAKGQGNDPGHTVTAQLAVEF